MQTWSVLMLYVLTRGIFNFNPCTPQTKLFFNFIKSLVVLRLCMPDANRATTQVSSSNMLLDFKQTLSAIATLSCTGLVQDHQQGEI